MAEPMMLHLLVRDTVVVGASANGWSRALKDARLSRRINEDTYKMLVRDMDVDGDIGHRDYTVLSGDAAIGALLDHARASLRTPPAVAMSDAERAVINVAIARVDGFKAFDDLRRSVRALPWSGDDEAALAQPPASEPAAVVSDAMAALTQENDRLLLALRSSSDNGLMPEYCAMIESLRESMADRAERAHLLDVAMQEVFTLRSALAQPTTGGADG